MNWFRKQPKPKLNKTAGPTYSSQRQALHARIIQRIVREAGEPDKGVRPLAILVGGGTAAGKTTLRHQLLSEELLKRGVYPAIVDADELKEEIPEYQTLKKTRPDQAAALVHKESLDIAALLLKRLRKERKHLLYEGTLARTKKIVRLVEELKSDGYAIQLYIVDLPLKLAKKRARRRARATGRHVPRQVIEKTHRLVPRTFLAIKDKVDQYYIYDNRDGLKLIASRGYVHSEQYAQFIQKGEKRTRWAGERDEGGDQEDLALLE